MSSPDPYQPFRSQKNPRGGIREALLARVASVRVWWESLWYPAAPPPPPSSPPPQPSNWHPAPPPRLPAGYAPPSGAWTPSVPAPPPAKPYTGPTASQAFEHTAPPLVSPPQVFSPAVGDPIPSAPTAHSAPNVSASAASQVTWPAVIDAPPVPASPAPYAPPWTAASTAAPPAHAPPREATHPAAPPSDFRPQPASVRRLNKRLLVGSVLALVLLLPALVFWVRFQQRQSAGIFLTQADVKGKAEEWERASALYFSYLRLQPNNHHARILLAEAYDHTADSPSRKQRALELFQAAIQAAPDEVQPRRRLTELWLDLGRPEQAEIHADHLLERFPRDAQGMKLKGIALYQQAKASGRISLAKVVSVLRRALDLAPDDVQLAADLADIYRRELESPEPEQRASVADSLMNRLIERNAQSHAALLARYDYRRRYGIPDADGDLDRAQQLAPEDLEVLLAVGQRAVDRRDDTLARECFTRVVQKASDDRRGYLALCELEARQGQSEAALKIAREGLEKVDRQDMFLNLRVAELLVTLGRPAEAADILTAVEYRFSAQAGGATSDFRNEFQTAQELIRAKWYFQQQEYHGAVPRLRRALVTREVLRGGSSDVQRLIEVYYQLAGCYEAQKQYDLAAETLEKAARTEPKVPRHYLAAAGNRQQLGQHEAAIQLYEQAVATGTAPPETYLALAHNWLAHLRTLPETARNWQSFDQTLNQARQAATDPKQLALLEAESLTARGQADQAVTRLESQLAAASDSFAVVRAAALAYEHTGRGADTDRLLADYETRAGASVDLVLLRANVLSRRHQWEAAIQTVESRLAAATPEDRARLAYQLAQLHLQAGKPEAARQVLRLLADTAPNLEILQLLADLALEARDFPDAQALEGRLRELEGDDGTSWRYTQARRLLAECKNTDDPRLQEAARLEAALQVARPGWASAFLLRGQLAERRHDLRQALEAYDMAIQLGEPSLLPLERAASIHFQHGRLAEVERYLRRLPDDLIPSRELAAVAVAVALRQAQPEKAIRLAEEVARCRPQDAANHLLLGSTLAMAGRSADAEAPLRKSIELDPTHPPAWLALIGVLAGAGRQAEIEPLWIEMRAKLPPAAAEITIAKAYELLNQAARAEETYLAAIQANPEDRGALQAIAQYYLRQARPADSIQYLERIVAAGAGADAQYRVHVVWARRQLARLVAREQGYRGYLRAVELIEANRRQGALDVDDLLLFAEIKAAQPRHELHLEAVRMMEEARELRPLSLSERFRLAELYERVGNWDRCREEATQLLEQDPRNITVARAYILWLLAHQEKELAAKQIREFEKLHPQTLVGAELRVAWLLQHGYTKQALETVDHQLPEPLGPEHLTALERLAALLNERAADVKPADRAALDKHAEHLVRRYVELRPEARLVLADFLITRGRAQEALDVCEQALTGPQASRALELGLRALEGLPTELRTSQYDRLERWLNDMEDKRSVQFLRADLRSLQQRFDEAAQIYRELLELEDLTEQQKTTAWNNLAFLLAMKDKNGSEALDLVQQAIDVNGNQAELLDTRGVAFLVQGDRRRAVADLEAAVRDRPDPLKYFHLAWAYQESRRTEEAQRALDEARRRGLTPDGVSPLERPTYDALVEML